MTGRRLATDAVPARDCVGTGCEPHAVPLRRAAAVEPSEQDLPGRERTPRIDVSALPPTPRSDHVGAAHRVSRATRRRVRSRVTTTRDDDARRREHA
jgi:hypothetical protein